MDILSLLILIPLVTAIGLLIAKKDSSIKLIALGGSILQLSYSVWLTLYYIAQRNSGVSGDMLFQNSITWFAPLHIFFSTGVDGISLDSAHCHRCSSRNTYFMED